MRSFNLTLCRLLAFIVGPKSLIVIQLSLLTELRRSRRKVDRKMNSSLEPLLVANWSTTTIVLQQRGKQCLARN